MASEAPACVDVMHYQFKLHEKSEVFDLAGNLRNNIDLLAVSSNYGLLFVGDPYKQELRVLQLQNIVNENEPGELKARNVILQGIPNNISVSCDGTLLAVSYTINNLDILSIFSVPSFWTTNIETKFNIRVYPEDNVHVIQILWNPVISNTFALILNNGAVGMYNLKDTSYEFYSIDKSEQAKCACWSPKGKQIVIGFPEGKLVQYKPDLKPAKIISCPPNIHESPFDTIAVQWLSTYQFAVVFIQRGEDKVPNLYILNAPKNGNSTYINYYDICYSSSGPRQAQIFFHYIQSWNLLLMASANSVEVGILGTKETGETPTWQQYIPSEETRIELPFTSDKQETYPIGFVLDTGCVHQLTICETQIPIMPMIHILSTHGMLISFNFLNLVPNTPGICSPPNPISDSSGQFRPINEFISSPTSEVKTESQQQIQTEQITEAKTGQSEDTSFSFSSGVMSTPIADRKTNANFGESPSFGNLTVSKSIFGTTTSVSSNSLLSKPLTTEIPAQQNTEVKLGASLFGGKPFGSQKPLIFDSATPKSNTGFGVNSSVNQTSDLNQLNQPKDGSFAFGQTLTSTSQSGPIIKQPASKPEDPSKTKPLYTVSPIFTPSQPQQIKSNSNQQSQHLVKSQKEVYQNSSEVDEIIKQMIMTEIQSFEKELYELSTKTEDLDISPDSIDEIKEYTKRLNDLKELNDQAKDGGIESDVRALRHLLNECFAMIAEVKSKLNMYKNPQLPQLATMSGVNQTNRRQLAKLNQLIATNEVQLNMVHQLMNAQWSNYQDLVKQNSSKLKYNPSLEGIYQTMIRQKDILAQERAKLNYFKSKLGVRGLLDQINNKIVDADSLADSILSMSLSEQVLKENSRLTDEKLSKIREAVKCHKIIKIKPKRPDRVGLNSEVILESKTKTMKQRDGAVTKPEKMEKERVKDEQRTITKPTPTKAVSVLNSNQTMNTQIKKIEPKAQPQIQVPVQNSFQMGAQAVSQQRTPQQTKEIQFSTASPVFPSIGSSFVKPAEFSQTQQTVTPSIFSGASQTSLFGGSKPFDQMKPAFEPFVLTSQPQETSDKSKTSIFSFVQPAAEKTTIVKQQTATSFVPKLLDNEQQSSFGLGFANIQIENKPTTDVKADNSKSTEPAQSEQTSLFSSLSLGSPLSAENKSISSGTGFNVLPLKDTNATQNPLEAKNSSTPPTTQPTLSFGALSLTTKQTDATKPKDVSSTPSSNSTSTDSLTSSTTVTESFSFVSSKTQPQTSSSGSSLFSFGSLQKSLTTSSVSAPVIPVSTVTNSSTEGLLVPSTAGTSLTTTSSTFNFSSFGNLNLPSSITITPIIPNEGNVQAETTAKTSGLDDESSNIVQNLSICKPNTTADATSTQSPAVNVFSGTLFGSKPADVVTTSVSTPTSLAFGTPASNAPLNATAASGSLGTSTFSGIPNTTSSSIFGGAATSSQSLFGNVPTTTAAPLFSAGASTSSTTSVFGSTVTSTPVFGTSAITSTTSIFGGSAMSPTSTAPSFGSSVPASTSASIFGGGISAAASLPVFGSSTTTVTTATGSIFGGTSKPTFGAPAFGSSTGFTQPASSTSSIFGGSTGTGFGIQQTTSTPSAFGKASVNQSTSPFGTNVNASNSVFGSPQPESTNLFGNLSQTNSVSGGSLFGASPAFGSSSQTTGSIFGGNAGSGAQSTGFSSPFSQVGTATSPFGATSVFGGGSATTFNQNTSFGSPSSFGQTTAFGLNSPGGSFAQGGPSIAQTGFGSPGVFQKPTFGASPTFGGAPNFGSPKSGFGSFGATANTGAFTPQNQKNNLFESLGSSDTGLSFGNLAQNTANNAAKPQFGGSSFSSWR